MPGNIFFELVVVIGSFKGPKIKFTNMLGFFRVCSTAFLTFQTIKEFFHSFFPLWSLSRKTLKSYRIKKRKKIMTSSHPSLTLQRAGIGTLTKRLSFPVAAVSQGQSLHRSR
ncbi:Hypothetical protein Minf_1247 [Methylacidiphilum infernorum V4]|uniref:Uncharacterized protein n=1 Tax=Methylacidiphilum infernorum (isolate V4) TaxID=481448 RepID=B3DVE8_METI4|nr:Hypothetical protein Minf_1247 [Methylacidiphilum infernorum V4]